MGKDSPPTRILIVSSPQRSRDQIEQLYNTPASRDTLHSIYYTRKDSFIAKGWFSLLTELQEKDWKSKSLSRPLICLVANPHEHRAYMLVTQEGKD